MENESHRHASILPRHMPMGAPLRTALVGARHCGADQKGVAQMRIEHNTRRRIPWLAILITIGWLLLAAGWWHTMTSFTPRMRQVSIDLADMNEQMDEIMDDLQEIKSDLNWDGQVDQLDLDLLFNYILRRPGEYPADRLDLNGDGRINSIDLHVLYQRVTELEALHEN